MAGQRRWAWVAACWVVLLGAAVSSLAGDTEPKRRPNILVVIADDWSWPYASVLDEKAGAAREGVLFSHAFAAAPSCTTSRAAILTGQAIHRLGDGGNQSGRLPAEHRVYPDALEEAGYFVGYTGKGWGPGNLRASQRSRNPAGPRFASFDEFLEKRPAGAPFCFWYGSYNPHRPYERDSGLAAGMDPATPRLAPFLPDDEVVRRDLLDHLVEVQRFDDELGRQLLLLERHGLLEDTLVVATSDQGMPFPRSKTTLYDSGVRIPLALMWKGTVPGGRVVDDLVGQTDFAPTFLAAAGVAAWPEMTGRSFWDVLQGDGAGRVDSSRDHVFVERERHGVCREGDKSYPVRGIRTDKYLYLRNLRPELLPAGDPRYPTGIGPFGDLDPGPTKDFLLGHRCDARFEDAYRRATAPRPAEELYDCSADPHQMNNLAAKSELAEVKEELRTGLDRWMESTGDPRALGETDLWDKAPFFGSRASVEQRERFIAEWEAGEDQRPNIVVILADDMGYSDLGCFGGEISTPNLDRLAEGGLRFTGFYNSARCCPSRAALLTGLYPHQSGMGHMDQDWGLPSYRGRLNDCCFTLGELLQQAGYRTILAGKWHVGDERGGWPLDRGFERFYGTPQGGGHYFRMLPDRQLVQGEEVVEPPADWYSTEAFTDQAVRYVREAAEEGKPFFCYLAYFAPHYPLHARPDEIAPYLGKYREGWEVARAGRFCRQVEMGIVPSGVQLSPPSAEIPRWEGVRKQAEMDRRMAVYAAQVSNLDRGVGRLVAELERADVLENTLLMFLSDNGATMAGGPLGFTRTDRGKRGAETGTADSYASAGMGWANVSNTPFRDYKSRVYEGGIATPLIVHWPAKIRDRGAIRRQVGHVIDLVPTCLAAADVDYPTERDGKAILPLEGKSLLPAFEAATAEPRTLCWEHMGNRAVREGKWKLVALHGKPWELYDLDSDPTETNNLADGDPERARRMAAIYTEWAERCGVIPWDERPR